jgi:hypothetical protein
MSMRDAIERMYEKIHADLVRFGPQRCWCGEGAEFRVELWSNADALPGEPPPCLEHREFICFQHYSEGVSEMRVDAHLRKQKNDRAWKAHYDVITQRDRIAIRELLDPPDA